MSLLKETSITLAQNITKKKVDVFANVDLIIMPSKEEPFGLVALEAMAAAQNGKTIVATSRVHGLSEFCNDEKLFYIVNLLS